MTDQPLTLVRLWQDNFTKELPSAWVEWDDGRFALDRETPAGSAIYRRMPSSQIVATVLSTDEIAWAVRSTEWHRADGLLRVECVPYLEMLKTHLRSDEIRCEIWLAAERRWLESQRKMCRNCGKEIREIDGRWLHVPGEVALKSSVGSSLCNLWAQP